MTAPRTPIRSVEDLRGRHTVVLGLARSGVAATRFLADAGAVVVAYDRRPAAELADAVSSLGARPLRLALGVDQLAATALLAHADLLVTSPSISTRYSTTDPWLREALLAAEQRGAELVSEVELFLRLTRARILGVTGTKGKTTTASLLAGMLGRSGLPSVLGGNIGTPLIERATELGTDHWAILELSELQLPTISRGTEVSVYTHVTSDHLDRHGTVEAYRAAKRRLAELAPARGRLVLNAEDPVSAAFASAGAARPVFYQRGAPRAGGVGVRDGWIVADDIACLDSVGGGRAATGPGGRIMPLGEVVIPGAHNTSNVLAAVAVGLLFGIAPDAIRRAVAGFTGVEHRLEGVATIDGVTFVNDSQGTQPDAVIAALRSFSPPIVLIAGGRTKNVPLDELAREVAQRAAAAVLIGETAGEMAKLFTEAGLERVEHASDMEVAVRRGFDIARELAPNHGAATVLLSPAATSFDMFVDYAARGQAFKSAVRQLAEESRS